MAFPGLGFRCLNWRNPCLSTGRPADPGQELFEALGRLSAAVASERFGDAVAAARQVIGADPGAGLSHPVVQGWIGRRYRYLFTVECARSAEALALAGLDIGRAAGRGDAPSTRGPVPGWVRSRGSGRRAAGSAGPAVGRVTLLFAPGLLTGLLPDLALCDVWPLMHARFGLRVIAADAHPMRRCGANVADLAAALTQGVGYDESGHFRGPGEATSPAGDVLVVAYSKGGPDTLALLAERPELAGRIRAVVGWAPAFLGSPVADEVLSAAAARPSDARPGPTRAGGFRPGPHRG